MRLLLILLVLLGTSGRALASSRINYSNAGTRKNFQRTARSTFRGFRQTVDPV